MRGDFVSKIRANARWIENIHLIVDNGRTHRVVCHVQQASGRLDTGPTALELALMPFAGCAVTICATLTRKAMPH